MAAPTLKEAAKLLYAFADSVEGAAWKKWAMRTADYLATGAKGKPAMSIFALKGNDKLPFAAWSTLPVYTCPGAGECVQWCYSLKSWRTAQAFFRQIQNTLLLRFKPAVVGAAFLALAEGIDVRLYVDGDFSSVAEVGFWMRLIGQRADLKVYGYSKSWDQLLEYSWGRDFPANYVLNLSGGGRAQTATAEDMQRLTITRGSFIALPIDYRPEGGKKIANAVKYADPTYHAAVRRAAKQAGLTKVFSCPGSCGGCRADAGKGHACGDSKLIGLNIVIGIH